MERNKKELGTEEDKLGMERDRPRCKGMGISYLPIYANLTSLQLLPQERRAVAANV